MAQLQRPRKQKLIEEDEEDQDANQQQQHQQQQDDLGPPPDIAEFEQEIARQRNEQTKDDAEPAEAPVSIVAPPAHVATIVAPPDHVIEAEEPPGEDTSLIASAPPMETVGFEPVHYPTG